ncbi:MAG: phosphoribosylglycinamide formyltransferase [Planctomycetota bacterium]|jgi:formyltetrahydrofolate-dependent phosphoribosylglycinamide formyltransferase
MTVSLAVLVSGGGTTLLNLVERIRDGRLDAEVRVVISSKEGVKGISRAEEAGIPAFVVARKQHDSVESFSTALTEVLDRSEPDLLIMGGFLSLYLIPPQYEGRVMNIHPALIPLFCGKGFYGMRVHKAVLESGMKVSGCTVHFADNVYDHGPIIVQRAVPVLSDDTPEDLKERVFAEECEAYPEAIRLFAEGRLEIEENRVKILPRS